MNLFLYDVKFPNSLPTQSPRRATFIRHVLPLLEPLRETLSVDSGNAVTAAVSCVEEQLLLPVGVAASGRTNEVDIHKTALEEVAGNHLNATENGSSENSERKNLINLCKTSKKTTT